MEQLFRSIQALQQRLNEAGIRYVLHWLRQFEIALDDSTLVAQYKQWRRQFG